MNETRPKPASPCANGRSPTPIAIWGGGGHASVVAEILQASAEWRLSGVLLDAEWVKTIRPALKPLYVGGLEACHGFSARGITHVVVAIGDNGVRVRIAAQLAVCGMTLAVVIHPSATVSPSATIGAGTVICPHAVVNAGASVGENCIINTAAVVEHDCQLGDAVHISTGACLAGRVRVASGTWIGAGAIIRDRVAIGGNAVIGAGAVVVKDVPASVVCVGNPARILRGNINEQPRTP